LMTEITFSVTPITKEMTPIVIGTTKN
jgi:hypothetical protein